MKKIVAMFGVKYDKDLLPDLIKNLDFVDDFAILYDMHRKDLWRNEFEYRNELRKIAEEKKADWVVVTSPDERFEKFSGKIIRTIVETIDDNRILQFNLREMWTPNQYRVDGIWGKKTRLRMYPLKDGQQYLNYRIQAHPHPIDSKGNPFFPIIDTKLNIYHLKMIEPDNRKLRAEVFKKLDPNNEYQKIGYDYLYDETGLRLKRIPLLRGYKPKYKKYVFDIPKAIKIKHNL